MYHIKQQETCCLITRHVGKVTYEYTNLTNISLDQTAGLLLFDMVHFTPPPNNTFGSYCTCTVTVTSMDSTDTTSMDTICNTTATSMDVIYKYIVHRHKHT